MTVLCNLQMAFYLLQTLVREDASEVVQTAIFHPQHENKETELAQEVPKLKTPLTFGAPRHSPSSTIFAHLIDCRARTEYRLKFVNEKFSTGRFKNIYGHTSKPTYFSHFVKKIKVLLLGYLPLDLAGATKVFALPSFRMSEIG